MKDICKNKQLEIADLAKKKKKNQKSMPFPQSFSLVKEKSNYKLIYFLLEIASVNTYVPHTHTITQ